MRVARLSIAEVFEVNPVTFKALNVTRKIPNIYKEHTIINVTSSNEIFFVEKWLRRKVPLAAVKMLSAAYRNNSIIPVEHLDFVQILAPGFDLAVFSENDVR